MDSGGRLPEGPAEHSGLSSWTHYLDRPFPVGGLQPAEVDPGGYRFASAVGAVPGVSGGPVSADDIHPSHYVFCPEGIRFNMGGRQKSHQISSGLLFGDGTVRPGKAIPAGLIYMCNP